MVLYPVPDLLRYACLSSQRLSEIPVRRVMYRPERAFGSLRRLSGVTTSYAAI